MNACPSPKPSKPDLPPVRKRVEGFNTKSTMVKRYARELAYTALRSASDELRAPLIVRDHLKTCHRDCPGWHPMLHSIAMKAFLSELKELRA